MLARRLLVLTAVLMLLIVLAGGLAPRRTAAPPAAGAAALPTGGEVTRTIPSGEGADTRVHVRRGDVLELQVEGDELDSVLLERLDRIDAVDPSTPARFTILVDVPAGSYPIRLIDADRRIGAIQVAG